MAVFEERPGALPWWIEYDHVVAALGRMACIADRDAGFEPPASKVTLAGLDRARILFYRNQRLGPRGEPGGEVSNPAVELQHAQPLRLGELDHRLDELFVHRVVGLRKRLRGTLQRFALSRSDQHIGFAPSRGTPRLTGSECDPGDDGSPAKRLTGVEQPWGRTACHPRCSGCISTAHSSMSMMRLECSCR